MTVQTAHSLKLSRTVPVSPETAFDAWTQPEQARKWSCPEGAVVHDIKSDFRVGGAYRLQMKNAEGGFHTATGTYQKIERPHAVSYTWDWEEEDHHMGIATLVTVTFQAVDGGTEVTVVHDGFPVEEAKDAHEMGWGSCLNQYERVFG
jgi:glutathione S-transferase